MTSSPLTEVSNMPGGPNTAQSLRDDGWRWTDSRRGRPLCTVGLGHCDVIMNVGKLTQAQMALRITVAYLLHVLPYVGLVRTFTRHCRLVISWWLVTTVTLLVAVRHQFTRPAVGLCCTAAGSHFFLPRIPFTAVNGCSEWNTALRGGGGRVPAGAADSGSHLLNSVTGFWEMKPDTALKSLAVCTMHRYTSSYKK